MSAGEQFDSALRLRIESRGVKNGAHLASNGFSHEMLVGQPATATYPEMVSAD